MSDNKLQAHDATTGFADIKPVEMVPESINFHLYLTAAFLAFGLLFAVLLMRHFLKLFKSDSEQNAIDNFSLCQSQITDSGEKFRSNKMDSKEYSENISLALRTLISKLTNYPAQDRTLKEISGDFPKILAEKFSRIESSKKEVTNAELLKVLDNTSRITFSDPASGEQLSNDIESTSLSIVQRMKEHISEEDRLQKIEELNSTKAEEVR